LPHEEDFAFGKGVPSGFASAVQIFPGAVFFDLGITRQGTSTPASA